MAVLLCPAGPQPGSLSAPLLAYLQRCVVEEATVRGQLQQQHGTCTQSLHATIVPERKGAASPPYSSTSCMPALLLNAVGCLHG